MSNISDRIIEDLIKGAERTEGFLRGSRVGVEVARENRGREEKLAMGAGMGALLGGAGGVGLAALTGAHPLSLASAGSAAAGAGLGGFLGSDEGRGAAGGLGALGGGVTGAVAGDLLGGLTGNRHVLNFAPLLGTAAGAYLGGRTGGDAPEPGLLDRMRAKLSSDGFAQGAHAAARAFGVDKTAFVGAIAGMGASALGGAVAKKLAPKAMGALGKGALEMGGQVAGGMAADKLMPQR